MTGAFGFRCGEALCLKREDINVEATIPKITITGESIGARKSPGSVYVRRQHVQLMKNFLKKGVTCKRTRGHKHGKGTSKQITFQDTYSIPCTGYIFPSRKNAKRPYMCYHAVYNQVRREAPRFLKQLQANGKQWGPEIAKLRPHSGRATLITELMGEGLTTALSMKYARHAPNSFKVHLKYGRLVLQDLQTACDVTRNSNPRAAKRSWATMSTQRLLQSQKEIAKELARRACLK